MYAVIVAAGNSARFNSDRPKQYISICGQTPIVESVKAFHGIDNISGVVCVISPDHQHLYESIFQGHCFGKLLPPVFGGKTRAESVRNGLNFISDQNIKHVLIHDAARYKCSPALINRVVDRLLEGCVAVVPTVQSVDSLRYNGKNIDRSKVGRVQTPQGFEFETIYNLHKKHIDANVTDDASLCDIEGIDVIEVQGEETNTKLTYLSDIKTQTIIKTGFGYDVHKFSNDPKRKLFLMGVEVPGYFGLEGVSDADVAIHSIVDAILGALGKGSIGEHFSIKDPLNQDRDSKEFLQYCKNLLEQSSATILNIDVTIVCEEPKISILADSMKKITASCLGIKESDINVKGKTTEGLGFEGRREGISSYAVATVSIEE